MQTSVHARNVVKKQEKILVLQGDQWVVDRVQGSDLDRPYLHKKDAEAPVPFSQSRCLIPTFPILSLMYFYRRGCLELS